MTRSGFTWTSAAGKAVAMRLDAYGELRRWELRGETAALTTASGGGGSRRKPDDMPEWFHGAWDVEASLREWGCSTSPLLHAYPAAQASHSLMLRLVDHMWTHGREKIVTSIEFFVVEGPPIVMTPDEERFKGAPGKYFARVEHEEWVSTYVLDLFEDEFLDKFTSYLCPRDRGEQEWWRMRADLLLRHHTDFGAFMAERRGLGEFGLFDEPIAEVSGVVAVEDLLPSYGEPTAEELAQARTIAKLSAIGAKIDDSGNDRDVFSA